MSECDYLSSVGHEEIPCELVTHTHGLHMHMAYRLCGGGGGRGVRDAAVAGRDEGHGPPRPRPPRRRRPSHCGRRHGGHAAAWCLCRGIRWWHILWGHTARATCTSRGGRRLCRGGWRCTAWGADAGGVRSGGGQALIAGGPAAPVEGRVAGPKVIHAQTGAESRPTASQDAGRGQGGLAMKSLDEIVVGVAAISYNPTSSPLNFPALIRIVWVL